MSTIDDIRDLADSARALVWEVHPRSNGGDVIAAGDPNTTTPMVCRMYSQATPPEAHLIVALRNNAEDLCRLADAVRRFVTSEGPCRYDHHGYCQEHWIGDGPCPIADVRATLARLDGEASHA